MTFNWPFRVSSRRHARGTLFSAMQPRLRRLSLAIVAAIALAVAGFGTGPTVFADNDKGNAHWVTTWSTALHAPDVGFGLTNPGFNGQTLRQIVHTSVGGDQVRVRLSTFGASAFGAAHIGLRSAGAAIVPGSDRILTFSGQPSITIPPGAIVLSDPVTLDVPALGDLAVSLFVPDVTGAATWHFAAFPGYFTPEGEAKRQAVNAWIRTSGAYDAVIDFDAATRDPSHGLRSDGQCHRRVAIQAG